MQMTEPDGNVVGPTWCSGKPYYYSNLNTTVKSSILADLSTENDSRENAPKAPGQRWTTHFKIGRGRLDRIGHGSGVR